MGQFTPNGVLSIFFLLVHFFRVANISDTVERQIPLTTSHKICNHYLERQMLMRKALKLKKNKR